MTNQSPSSPDRVHVFGRFRVLSVAGKGGMAVVYRAETAGAGGFSRPVALKMLLPALSRDESAIAMFIEEARVSARLDHPNIAQVHDFGEDRRGKHFLVLEWVEGLDLRRWVNARPPGEKPDWGLVGAISLEVLDALDFAHRHSDDEGRPAPVFHRDVSPGNILVGLHGHAKLTDFGLARAMDRARMTRQGAVKGKIAYLPPEMTRGADPTPRTDVFSFGVTLFEALARRPMFHGSTHIELLRKVTRGEAPELSDARSDLPSALTDLVMKSLRRDPLERYPTARAMRRDLLKVLESEGRLPDPIAVARSVAEARAFAGVAAPADASTRTSSYDRLALGDLDAPQPTSVELRRPR